MKFEKSGLPPKMLQSDFVGAAFELSLEKDPHYLSDNLPIARFIGYCADEERIDVEQTVALALISDSYSEELISPDEVKEIFGDRFMVLAEEYFEYATDFDKDFIYASEPVRTVYFADHVINMEQYIFSTGVANLTAERSYLTSMAETAKAMHPLSRNMLAAFSSRFNDAAAIYGLRSGISFDSEKIVVESKLDLGIPYATTRRNFARSF